MRVCLFLVIIRSNALEKYTGSLVLKSHSMHFCSYIRGVSEPQILCERCIVFTDEEKETQDVRYHCLGLQRQKELKTKVLCESVFCKNLGSQEGELQLSDFQNMVHETPDLEYVDVYLKSKLMSFSQIQTQSRCHRACVFANNFPSDLCVL